MRLCHAPLCTFVLLAPALAQTPHHTTPAQPELKTEQLPVTRVALYKNGVGFFQHAGHVTGDGQVTIDFTTAQLNDVLQSLTALDLNGGRITGAGYNSTTPLDQQLKTLPLALGAAPSDVDFLNAIRGSRVEVTGPAIQITGRLLSIDLRADTPRPDGNNQPPAQAQRRFLTVVSDAGDLRTFELTAATHLRLLDTALHTDVSRYLELLAANRNGGLRHLTLEDRGSGPRNLLVSYISEVPVWKSTYRILFTEPKTAGTGVKETATVQGWSVVDNTTGSDWLNVRLSLIAGAPQSFIQPLSTPYYTRRPEIPLPAEAQLTPQTHESGESADSSSIGINGTVSDQSAAVIPNASITATNTATGAHVSGRSDGGGAFTLRLPSEGQYRVQITSPGFKQLVEVVGVSGGMEDRSFTLNVGSSSETVTVDANAASVMPLAAPMMTNRQVNGGVGGPIGFGSGNGAGLGAGGGMAGGAMRLGGGIALSGMNFDTLAEDSITPNTSTSAFDDYFEYTLADPITIRKNESALVPILQTRVPVERVTLWSERTPVALRALWITNSSTLTLDRGSFSIVENGSFGGEGLLDPVHPGERRLLSYAADQAVRISIYGRNESRRVERIAIEKGVLTEREIDVAELTYDVRNAAPETRTVILEHPVRPGYTLDSTPKPDETTPSIDRFRLIAQPGETVHLHVGERHTGFEGIQLTSRSEEQLTILLQNAHASPAALAALQPAFDAHNRVVALDDRIRAAEAEIASISTDQTRIRENLQALKGTPEEKALATRYTAELNTQEDRLAALRTQIAQLRINRTAADQDFQVKLQAIHFEETI